MIQDHGLAHLTDSGLMVVAEVKIYGLLLSERQDSWATNGSLIETCAFAALKQDQAVSCRTLTAEFIMTPVCQFSVCHYRPGMCRRQGPLLSWLAIIITIYAWWLYRKWWDHMSYEGESPKWANCCSLLAKMDCQSTNTHYFLIRASIRQPPNPTGMASRKWHDKDCDH